MSRDCKIVMDLLPLYVENMVSEETAQYVREHLEGCPECRGEHAKFNTGTPVEPKNAPEAPKKEGKSPFKRAMKKMNRKFHGMCYAIIIFFIFLGFGWTAGDNMMYNSLIMPLVGVFGYLVFGLKSVYKLPVLLLAIDLFICVFGLLPLDLVATLIWTLIYSVFVLVGVAIAFLLGYALKKEKTE